jgi:hypothetical protein
MDAGVVAGDHASKKVKGPETRADTFMGGFDVPVEKYKKKCFVTGVSDF